MSERINKLYKPAELLAAIAVLQANGFHNFEYGDAKGIVLALHKVGYRIVYTGTVDK